MAAAAAAAEGRMEARDMAMAMAGASVLKLCVANTFPCRLPETAPEVSTRCS